MASTGASSSPLRPQEKLSTACIVVRKQIRLHALMSFDRPLMNILMPRSLLLKYPQLADNLLRNQGRLTSHYDFYLTVRHLTR
jgi:hypothetical protein